MRYVPISCITEGMILGKTLYGSSEEVLLRAGTLLKNTYIEKIRLHGYNGAYIDDELSRDIEIHELVSEELKAKTVSALKKMFIQVETDKANPTSTLRNLQSMRALVENIFDELYNHKNFMVNMLDIKIFDDYTFYHSTNVTVLSLVLGFALGLKKDAMMDLGIAALFHDIGKVFISKDILNKEGRLTEEEYREIQEHSLRGYLHLKDVLTLSPKAYVGVLQHHEKYNGQGYPHGISGKDICLFGRIIAITDVYDALTSDRPYRKGLLPSEAMEYIMGNGDTQFDYSLVSVFAKKVAPYPIGSYVYLSDGREGLVSENFEECCLRPKVKVVKEADGSTGIPYHLDLKSDPSTFSITITEMDRG